MGDILQDAFGAAGVKVHVDTRRSNDPAMNIIIGHRDELAEYHKAQTKALYQA